MISRSHSIPFNITSIAGRNLLLHINDDLLQDLVAGFGIGFFERRIITVLVAYAFVYIILYLINACVFYGIMWKMALVTMLRSFPPYSLIFAIAGITFRRLALWRAQRMVSADKKRYDAIWDELLLQEQSRILLDNIQAKVFGHACPAIFPSEISQSVNKT